MNSFSTPPLPAPPPVEERPHTRWDFVWDVLMLQVKLFAAGVHNFILGPATLVAAAMDLIFRTGRHGSRFYRVLEWGRRWEGALGLYAALHRRYETINVAEDDPDTAAVADAA